MPVFTSSVTPTANTPAAEQSKPAKASKPLSLRGSNKTPPQPRYTGRNPRALRKVQNTLFAIRGRDATAEEAGALRSLANPFVRER